jgi:hypothetical protein
VVDVLEHVAVNQHHTPALYSSFLRALLAAKEGTGADASTATNSIFASTMSNTNSTMGSGDPFISGHSGDAPILNDFSFESEMGPVADMSTFPPTMAAHSSTEDASMMMNMDDLLPNGGFWNNVLMPGMVISLP